MAGCAIGSIGVVFSVSVAAPATQDAAGFAALTYTKVASLLSFPSFGGVAAVVSNTPLETGEECKSQGAINWGSIPLNGLYTEEEQADFSSFLSADVSQLDAFIERKLIEAGKGKADGQNISVVVNPPDDHVITELEGAIIIP